MADASFKEVNAFEVANASITVDAFTTMEVAFNASFIVVVCNLEFRLHVSFLIDHQLS